MFEHLLNRVQRTGAIAYLRVRPYAFHASLLSAGDLFSVLEGLPKFSEVPCEEPLFEADKGF
jgi:hypothetical protein